MSMLVPCERCAILDEIISIDATHTCLAVMRLIELPKSCASALISNLAYLDYGGQCPVGL